MIRSRWFDNFPVISSLTAEEAANRLRAVGEDEVAEALENMQKDNPPAVSLSGQKSFLSFLDRPWLYARHVFGYLAPTPPGNTSVPISPLNAIQADPTLKEQRVKITLNRFRVANYPGRGTHQILVHFYAQNQLASSTEDLHFNATYRVRKNDQVAIHGYPVFVGLAIGQEGIRLQCRTINVKNEQDVALLGFLESDVFKTGLQLVTIAQPAIAPFSSMAYGIAKAIAARHQNISVQDIFLGLDFGDIPTGARLAEGAYIAAQVPESEELSWEWDEWVYHPSSGQIAKRDNYRETLPYNYLIFGVSRYKG